MRKIIISCLILHLFWLSAIAAIGEWTVIPTSADFRRGEEFAGRIFLLAGNTLFSVNNEQYDNPQYYSRLTGLHGTDIFDIILSPSAQKLVVVYRDGSIDFLSEDGEALQISCLPDFANKVIMGDRSITGISEREGKLYIQTGFGFLIADIEKEEFEETYYFDIAEYKDGSYGERTSTVSAERLAMLNSTVKADGAGSSSNAGLVYCNGILLTANIESDFRSSLFGLPGIVSIYDTYDDTWRNIYAKDINPQTDGTTWFQGPTSIAIDPNDNTHYFVGTFALGLFEFRGEELVKCYNGFNTDGIESIIPDTYTTRIGGISVDNQGYIWFINVGTDKPLRCISPSGKVFSFEINGYTAISNGFDKLIVAEKDRYRFKWILGIRPWQRPQVGIYYDGGTPEETSDDESVSFTSLTDQDGNIYTPNYFNDICEDKDGKIWLLTSSGPFLIESQIEAFKHPGIVRRIKIPRNDGTNLADYLLAGVDCSCMTIDAANRKWIGTRDAGLYLLSADGLTQLEHFTADNSPLPSDNILALAYDDVSGTLFISCEGGMATYTTDAIRGAENYSDVVCFPNPVRPEYSGQLHITGLKDKTKVKICDIANNVVFSTISEGGSIVWDLVNESGARIRSGVYVVYGFDESGKGGVVTKFLVI